MQSKLTLRMDEHLIESAKAYSAQSGKSISRIVADLFTLMQHQQQKGEQVPLTPTVTSLKGILKGQQVSERDYRHYLEEKFL
jgi:hypothetical protein